MDTFKIRPLGPFSLAAARDFAGGFPAGIGGGGATATSLVMTFPLEPVHTDPAGSAGQGAWRHSAVAELTQPDDDQPVTVRVSTAGDPAAALRQVLRAVSLDHDGTAWPDVGRRDPVIGTLQLEQRYLRPVCFYSAYEAATSFVIGQRIARTQAARIKARLSELAGDQLEIDGRPFPAFPRPERLLEVPEVVGLSQEKMVRIHGLAEAALDGRLDTERLRGLPTGTALAELRILRGVGEFSAEAILLRGCGVVDEIPGSEAIGPEAVAELYGLDRPPDVATYAAMAEAWRPFRMWAVVLLRVGWGRRQAGPVSYRRERRPG